MSKSADVIPASTARRMLLQGQGLLGLQTQDLATFITQLGFVQVDTINVVERAHHLTLFSRLPKYQRSQLANLLERERLLFEHWTHDASIIPLQWYSHWRHRFDRYRKRKHTNAWWKQRLGENPRRTMREVLQRIEREGPALSRDFEYEGKNEPWWGWKPHKAALEHLWRCGELAIARRVNFQKVYDLPERVYPAHHAQQASAKAEHVDWACRSALERFGAATPGEIAAFWHAISPTEARTWCVKALKKKVVEQVVVETADGSKPRLAFVLSDWRERFAAALEGDDADVRVDEGGMMKILNPFDPVLRDRKRTKRLFDFEYTFEAFVPEAKRRFGYFVMPVLRGERLIGRINPKLHRDRGVLEVKGVWWEQSVRNPKGQMKALLPSLEDLAKFLGANRVEVTTK